MKKPAVGFLPLYVELYDRQYPEMRPRIEAFSESIASKLSSQLDIISAPICRLEHEFSDAIALFKEKGAIAIITLHLDYSPSLESAKPLAASGLPIIVLDTTEKYYFGPAQSDSEIMYNHGIHGVQDMCNLLIRNGVRFSVEAGHADCSDVIDRVVNRVYGIQMASVFRKQRVGAIGGPFEGMGDFVVSRDELRSRIGIEVLDYDEEASKDELGRIEDKEIAQDWEYYSSRCNVQGIEGTSPLWERSSRMGLVLRKWIEREKLTAFTFNFQGAGRDGLPVIPFHEINDLMSKGVGYAGEGDVLTAAFVGSLLPVFPDTTFSEMFCPDWAEDSILLSHMGEMNISVMADRPLLVEKEFGFTSAENPAVTYGRLKAGKAFLADLAPFGNGRYSLIAVPVEILDVVQPDNLMMSIHGWFRPLGCDICRFLEEYSQAGGTHHLAIVYGDAGSALRTFADELGFDFVSI